MRTLKVTTIITHSFDMSAAPHITEITAVYNIICNAIVKDCGENKLSSLTKQVLNGCMDERNGTDERMNLLVPRTADNFSGPGK